MHVAAGFSWGRYAGGGSGAQLRKSVWRQSGVCKIAWHRAQLRCLELKTGSRQEARATATLQLGARARMHAAECTVSVTGHDSTTRT